MRAARPTIRAGGEGRAWGRAGARVAARRGLTFLEVIFAVSALALLTATVMTAVNYVQSRQDREQQQLAATELASRLLLMYLDSYAHVDGGSDMPSQSEPIAYGRSLYRWTSSLEPIRLDESEGVRRARQGSSRQSGVRRDRFVQINVTVWLSEHSGGAAAPVAGVPQSTLVRVMDPIARNRNPDSIQRLYEDPTKRNQFITEFLQNVERQ